MLSTKQPAPPIDTVSLSGRPIDLGEFHGKKVLVKFHRFSGCPVARRQIHDLIEDQEALNAAGIETIVVLHSSQENAPQLRRGARSASDRRPAESPLPCLPRGISLAEAPIGRDLARDVRLLRPRIPAPIQQVPGRDHRRPQRLPPRRTRHDHRHPLRTTLRRLLDGRRRSPSCQHRTRGSRPSRLTASARATCCANSGDCSGVAEGATRQVLTTPAVAPAALTVEAGRSSERSDPA